LAFRGSEKRAYLSLRLDVRVWQSYGTVGGRKRRLRPNLSFAAVTFLPELNCLKFNVRKLTYNKVLKK
jgi:hypothetical protein